MGIHNLHHEPMPLALPPPARLTPARRALVGAIARRPGGFTVVELYDDARRDHAGLGLATVYRTLELLRRHGLVRQLAGGGTPTYLRCHPGHHHHLVCLTCGTIEETDLCAVPPSAEVRRRHGFRPEAHELDIYGTCGQCLAA